MEASRSYFHIRMLHLRIERDCLWPWAVISNSCILAPELTELADDMVAAMGASALTPYSALHLRMEGMRKAELMVFSSMAISSLSLCMCSDEEKSRAAEAAHTLHFAPASIHLARKVLAAFLGYRDP